MDLKERIQQGLNGHYSGLDNGLPLLSKYIFGIQKAVYILLGGDSGTYKTSLVDFMLQKAIVDAERRNIKLNVFYNSWEIDELTKKCNWLSNRIFEVHKVVIPPAKIKGLGNLRMNAQEQLLVDTEIPYIEAQFAKIHWSWTPENPTGVYKKLWNFAETRGTILREDYIDEHGAKKSKVVGYVAKDPLEVTICATDHLYYLRKERGMSTKEVIDKYSEYCVELRNLFGDTFINISQFNDGISSVERLKFKGVDLSPQKSDYKDSRNPYSDSDIVLGTMNPYKLDMDDSMGYNVKLLGKYFVMLKLLKNRLEEDNLMFPLFANPKAGQFIELPSPKTIDYSKFKV
jgi:hypothetical protein